MFSSLQPTTNSEGFPARDSKKATTPTILSPTSPTHNLSSPTSPSHNLNNSDAPRLPRAQNPTITLLQKARGMRNRVFFFKISKFINSRIFFVEGQLPKGAAYLEETDHRFRNKLQEERHRYTPNEYSKFFFINLFCRESVA